MKNSAMHPKNGHKLGFLLRILTMFWAILGPVAVIAAAVVSTVLEGDWWSELFYMYLALYTLLGFTTYFPCSPSCGRRPAALAVKQARICGTLPSPPYSTVYSESPPLRGW